MCAGPFAFAALTSEAAVHARMPRHCKTSGAGRKKLEPSQLDLNMREYPQGKAMTLGNISQYSSTSNKGLFILVSFVTESSALSQ